MAFRYISAKIKNYLSLVKFAHTIFALPFAVLGFFMATVDSGEIISERLFLLVLACMFLARNAAMSFNRWADREFDRINPRTSQREIPSEVIKPGYALAFSLINALLFILATWFINRLCFYLSPVALFIVLGYSLTKRFTSLSHFVLGLGLALAPTGAYLAVSGEIYYIPVMISTAVLLWVTGFDIIYSLQDDEFDLNYKLRSIPVAWGRKNALTLSFILHLISAILLIAVGVLYQSGNLYWIGLGVFCVMLFYQHTLVKPDNLSKVNIAFFTLNGIASLVFSMFAVADLMF